LLSEPTEWGNEASVTVNSDAGDVSAMQSLGAAYRNGIGVERNEDEAERWFAKARQ
jgi:TPR repeat protein